jgi:hemolysin III
MAGSHKHTTYPPAEERINIYSHALGLLLSVAALFMLIVKADGLLQVISTSVFALSLIALYASSTIYHSTTDIDRRAAMRTVDHAMIYILIAGTYTPFSLLILQGTVGWVIFGISWSMAAIGITIKLFFTGRFNHVSTAMYVFMGWVIVFAIKPLIAGLPPAGFIWLFAGGIAYTVGALFYSISKMPFGHATFHVFCLTGSACHFVALYFFVLS